MGTNIDAAVMHQLTWNHAAVEDSLAAVRAHVEAEAVKAAAWYFQRKRSKALLSRALRLGSIVLASAAGLLPIAASASASSAGPWASGLIASLLVGLAAALMGADKAFGFSSGWIRYVTTANAIRSALEEFRLEWTLKLARAEAKPKQAEVLELLHLAKTFRLLIESHVLEETKAWTNEFKGNLTLLEHDGGAQMSQPPAGPAAPTPSRINGSAAESVRKTTTD